MHQNWLDAFQKTLRYEREAAVRDVLEDLAQLSAFDRQMEGEEAKWKKRTGAVGCSSVLALVGTIASIATGIVPLAYLLGPIFLAAVVSSVVFGVKWSHFARLNLENRRIQVPQTVLQYLCHDMAPTQVVRLTLDFRNYRDPAFLKNSSKSGLFGAQRAYQYAVPWLNLRGQLLDGHRFDLSLTSLAKRKEKQKRKYTKVREAIRERLDLTVRVKTAKFPALAEISARATANGVPTPFQPTSIQVVNDCVELVGVTSPHFRTAGRGTSIEKNLPAGGGCTSDHALKSFLTVYAALDLCRG